MKGRIVKMARDGSKIILWIRGEDKKKYKLTVIDFKPYFYVPADDGSHISIYGERLRKIYVRDPGLVPKMREKYVKHYEADIPYVRRFLIDTGIKACVDFPEDTEYVSRDALKPCETCDIEPRYCILDIEVLSEGFPDKDNPVDPVTAFTLYDSWSDKYVTVVYKDGIEKKREKRSNNWSVMYVDDELDLFYVFGVLMSRLQPDIITGWNIYFDVDYLKARAKIIGFPLAIEGCEIFDLLEPYKMIFRRGDNRLKAVAKAEGILEEVKTVDRAMKAYREGNLDYFVEYNFQDVYVVKRIQDKHKLLEFIMGLKDEAGLESLSKALHNSVLIDTIALRIAKRMGYVLPSIDEGTRKRYEGAIVLKPPKGVVENVAVFDMSRYYPSIIISFNLSPETKSPIGEIKIEMPRKTVKFLKKPEGIIPQICKQLLKKRNEIEAELSKLKPGTKEYNEMKEKRNVVKYLVNAVYGVMAYPGFRLYDVDVAAAVTALGREGILASAQIAEKMGFKAIYGDTDSIMIQVPFDKVVEVLNRLNTNVARYFIEKYGVEKMEIRLKFERYYRRMFFKGVKKKYAGLVVWEDGKETDYVQVKGWEVVRRDTPPFVANLQRELLEMVLRGAAAEEVAERVRKAVEEYRKQPLDAIAIPRTLNRPLSGYKSRQAHIRGAILANMYLGTSFQQGSNVKLIYVKYVQGLPKTDVLCFDDVERLNGRKIVVDWDRMIEYLRGKVEDILKLYNLSWDAVINRETGLNVWF